MKCIIYISKAFFRDDGVMIPTGLPRLVRKAQKTNRKLGISSILSYRKTYYFQVMEGEDAAVDALYATIQADRRHERVVKILDFSITKRYFRNWSMKLLGAVSESQEFRNFVSMHSDQFNLLDESKHALLGMFFDHKKLSAENNENYRGANLALRGWPDFTVVKQTPTIIELCAKLIKQPRSYENLIHSQEFGDPQQIDQFLSAFERQGILKIVKSTLQEESAARPSNASGGFYSKMKKFLTLR